MQPWSGPAYRLMDAHPAADAPIILFDAECILCSANAQLVLRRDWLRQ